MHRRDAKDAKVFTYPLMLVSQVTPKLSAPLMAVKLNLAESKTCFVRKPAFVLRAVLDGRYIDLISDHVHRTAQIHACIGVVHKHLELIYDLAFHDLHLHDKAQRM